MTKADHPITYYLYRSDHFEEIQSQVILETSVSLTINGEVWFSFMCTPTDLEALTIGFMYNEELINTIDDIASVRVCPAEDNVDLWLNHPVQKPTLWKKTSGCTGGVTSTTIDPTKKTNLIKHPSEESSISLDQVNRLIDKLFQSQDMYKKTGGVHTSILTDGQNKDLIAEDIGRHNTLDKIAGKLLQNQLEFDKKILLTTGRISSEMIQKSLRIGASILISRTSPSTMSVEIAQAMGITLIGYARHNHFRLYTHPNRVKEFSYRAGGTTCASSKP